MIIGVTGQICSGTSSFMDFLVSKGFKSFSYSDILRDELKNRNIEITRENLQDLGDELREKKGQGVLSKMMIDKMMPENNYVIGNIRNPGEVDEFKKIGDFVLVKVDAPFEIRFERARRRNRECEPMEFEPFKKMEERDLGVGQKECGQQHAKVFDMVDKSVDNNGNLDDFEGKIDGLLRELGL